MACALHATCAGVATARLSLATPAPLARIHGDGPPTSLARRSTTGPATDLAQSPRRAPHSVAFRSSTGGCGRFSGDWLYRNGRRGRARISWGLHHLSRKDPLSPLALSAGR